MDRSISSVGSLLKNSDYDINKQPWRPIQPFNEDHLKNEDSLVRQLPVILEIKDVQIENRKDDIILAKDDVILSFRPENMYIPKQKERIENVFNKNDDFYAHLHKEPMYPYDIPKVRSKQNDKIHLLEGNKMSIGHGKISTTSPVYTSFTNLALNDFKIEKLGSINVKPHPIPVNKIVTETYQEIPDFKYLSTDFKEEISTFENLLNSHYTSTEHYESEDQNNNDLTKTTFETDDVNIKFTTISSNPKNDFQKVDSYETLQPFDIFNKKINREKDGIEQSTMIWERTESVNDKIGSVENYVGNKSDVRIQNQGLGMMGNTQESSTVMYYISDNSSKNGTKLSQPDATVIMNTKQLFEKHDEELNTFVTPNSERLNMHLIYNSSKINTANRTVTSFINLDSINYNSGSGSSGVHGPFQSSKWEYVNGTKIPMRNLTNTNKVFNETLQALVVHNTTPKSIYQNSTIAIKNKEPFLQNIILQNNSESIIVESSSGHTKPDIQRLINIDFPEEDVKLIVKNKDAPLQNLSSIFDSISSKLGIAPNIQTKTPPFRLSIKKQTTIKPSATETTNSSSENGNQGIVEPVDPNIAEILLKTLNSTLLENFAEVVTLRPVKSNTGVNGNLRPKPKLKKNNDAVAEIKHFTQSDKIVLHSTILSRLQIFDADKLPDVLENRELSFKQEKIKQNTESPNVNFGTVTSMSKVISFGNHDTSTTVTTTTVAEPVVDSNIYIGQMQEAELLLDRELNETPYSEIIHDLNQQASSHTERSQKFIVAGNRNKHHYEDNKNYLSNKKNKDDEINVDISILGSIIDSSKLRAQSNNPKLSMDHLKILANIAKISDSNNKTLNSNESLSKNYTINQSGLKILTKTYNKIFENEEKNIKVEKYENIGM